MEFLFLDDAKQTKVQREKMGTLTGVGGLSVPSHQVRELELALENICLTEYDFPEGAVFKWSPSRGHWFRDNIVDERRIEFFSRILAKCKNHDVTAFVAINDSTKKPANGAASDHEIDVLLLTLERFNTHLKTEPGFVIVAKPSGGTKDENKFLSECVGHKKTGTPFVKFDNLATNLVTMPFHHSRILQAADLIVSMTTAMVAGNTWYAEVYFDKILNLMKTDWRGLIGGTGLKIHPSYSYRNLYYWLLKEDAFPEGSSGSKLPDLTFPYATSPNKFR